MKREILYDIKIATGIAILLVVIGHLASRGQDGIEIYVKIKTIIYKFHMPLFLFLSGYISSYTYTHVKTGSDYLRFVKKKFIRLFPAYITLSVVFLLGKYVLGNQIDFKQELMNILVYPSTGSSSFLWYIYVLFLYTLVLPLIMKMVKRGFLILFIPSFIVSFLTCTSLFSLDFFFWYLPFFALGCYLASNKEKYTEQLRKIGPFGIFLFVIWSILEYAEIVDIPKNYIGFLGIITFHYVSSCLLQRSRFFEFLGGHSFTIYLFNTMFIGGAAYFLNKVLNGELYTDIFYFVIPVLILIGIYIPILLYKGVKKFFPVIAKYIH